MVDVIVLGGTTVVVVTVDNTVVGGSCVVTVVVEAGCVDTLVTVSTGRVIVDKKELTVVETVVTV